LTSNREAQITGFTKKFEELNSELVRNLDLAKEKESKLMEEVSMKDQ
jgi:hypothetical protein